MKPTTVLIVDDSALIRKLLSETLADSPEIQVVDTAVDAMDAREKIKRYNPQVVTLDIEMPGMDGLSFLEKIMTLRPMPVIMCSTLTTKGAEETIRALEIGAFDYISKPKGGDVETAIGHLKDELVEKIKAAAKANLSARSRMRQEQPLIPVAPYEPPGGINRHLIAIGSSTGGVEALRDIFQALPANVPPILITQHMPEQFTASFANRLDGLSQVGVCEAQDGMPVKSGHAYLAPGGARHMKLQRDGGQLVCRLEAGDPVSGHRPSVDVLFGSVAELIGPRAVGVILTGMGRDGAQGMLKMRERGAYNIGQNQSTCVVYGMPKVAHDCGATHVELPLRDIAAHMLAYCQQERKSANA